MRIVRRGATAVAAAVLGVVGAATGAEAASSVVSGWWTPASASIGPDVPDGGLLVQGGLDPSQPLAYAGISFVLSAGETPTSLTLDVAPGSASTASSTLALCSLRAPATDAQGGAASSAPGYDCATRVVAAPSGDGTTYTFDVAALARAGALDVAVLPTAPTDRVVLAEPEIGSLRSSRPADRSPLDGAGAPIDTAPPGDAALDGASGSVELDGAASGSFDVTAAAPPELPAAGEVTTDTTATTVPTVQLAVPSATSNADGDGGGGGPLPVLAFGGLALIAAVLWALAGNGSWVEAPEAGGAP